MFGVIGASSYGLTGDVITLMTGAAVVAATESNVFPFFAWDGQNRLFVSTFFFPMIIPWILCLWRVNQKSCGIQFFLFIAFGLENSKGFHLDRKFRVIPDFFNWQISVYLSIS